MVFKSQICTTKEQSERLLALGLKKESADMALVENWDWNEEDGKFFTGEYFERPIDYVEGLRDKWIPAWSLHRLMEIMPKNIGCYEQFVSCYKNDVMYINNDGYYFFNRTKNDNLYDGIIDCIKWAIVNQYINQHFLEEKK